MSDEVIRLIVGGLFFDVKKEILLKVKGTYFYGLLSSGAWHPDADGAYTIDRPALGFDRLLTFLSSGKLRVDGLNESEKECLYSNMGYFLIPYNTPSGYDTQSHVQGFQAHGICELNGLKLCGWYKNDFTVWNMVSNTIEKKMKGHTSSIIQAIQLHDGRVCTCSDDRTIKIWSVDSRSCKHTLVGHTSRVTCILQLLDGRVCSGSWDRTIRVWNLSTGECEMTLNTQPVSCICQLVDGRICCYDHQSFNAGSIYIYSLLTGECERSWKGHSGQVGYIYEVHVIVCIDSTRICTGSYDKTIKIWNIATGECERTLEGHTAQVTSLVLMHDGRLCSGSNCGYIILWDVDTGECAETIQMTNAPGSKSRFLNFKMVQLVTVADKRFVTCSGSPSGADVYYFF